jgi:hypothetical protein
MPDSAPLTAAAQQRALDQQLKEMLARAEKLVTTLRASSVQQRETVERAEAIAAKTKEVEALEVKVRNHPTDDNLVELKRTQRELKTLLPAQTDVDDEKTPEAEVKPVFCPIDGVAFQNGACPVDRRHTTGHHPYAGMKDAREHLKSVGLLR